MGEVLQDVTHDHEIEWAMFGEYLWRAHQDRAAGRPACRRICRGEVAADGLDGDATSRGGGLELPHHLTGPASDFRQSNDGRQMVLDGLKYLRTLSLPE